MAAALPTPDSCLCECRASTSTTPSGGGTAPQTIYDGYGAPSGLQVGVGGVLQNPAYPAVYTDKNTGVVFHWNTFTLAWDF